MAIIKKFRASLAFLVFLGVISCTTYRNSSQNILNVAFLYNPGSMAIHPRYVIFNKNTSSSELYFQIPAHELIYLNENGTLKTSLAVKYKLYNSSRNMLLCDTATLNFQVLKNESGPFIIKSFSVAARDSFSYFLDVSITDLNSEKSCQAFINIERSQTVNPGDAIFINRFQNPIFQTSFSDTDTFTVKLRKGLPSRWYVSWFANSFGPRPAPYATGNFDKLGIPKPDSTRIFNLADTVRFTLNRRGLMHFYLDTLKNGFSVKSFESDFPDVSTPYHLLQPLRLISSQNEFREMVLQANKKEAVDKFWMDATGNANRAAELIRVFYTRVKYANIYFSSYTEGWKTDRGIVYLVFGLPVTIYKAENVERWIYGTSQSNKTLVFNFVRVPNPFSPNDYIMSRDEMYKISWTQAVDTWRSGKIFSVSN